MNSVSSVNLDNYVDKFHQHEIDEVEMCFLYPTWDSNTHLSRKQKKKRKGLHCTIEDRGQEPLEWFLTSSKCWYEQLLGGKKCRFKVFQYIARWVSKKPAIGKLLNEFGAFWRKKSHSRGDSACAHLSRALKMLYIKLLGMSIKAHFKGWGGHFKKAHHHRWPPN